MYILVSFLNARLYLQRHSSWQILNLLCYASHNFSNGFKISFFKGLYKYLFFVWQSTSHKTYHFASRVVICMIVIGWWAVETIASFDRTEELTLSGSSDFNGHVYIWINCVTLRINNSNLSLLLCFINYLKFSSHISSKEMEHHHHNQLSFVTYSTRWITLLLIICQVYRSTLDYLPV